MASTSSTPTQRRVGRPPGPTEHGAASRTRILDAAAEVFARLGYDRARMADVVEASGMTKGSVYFHFESKEALAVAVLTEKHGQWLGQVRSSLSQVAPGPDRLNALLPAMLSLHRDDPYAWAVSRLAQNLAELPATRSLATELTQRWVDVVADVVRDALPPGTGPSPADPALVATLLVGAFDGLKATVQVLTDDPAVAARQLESGGELLMSMVRSAITQS
jgi:AcrR family transcriptional regulator